MAGSDSDRQVLAKIGFYLCRRGFVHEAESIFQGLAQSAPDRDGPAAGLAFCLIIRGKPEEAVRVVDARLARGATCSIPGQLMVYKLLALGMDGRWGEAESLRVDIGHMGRDDLVKTADALLEEVRRIKTL